MQILPNRQLVLHFLKENVDHVLHITLEINNAASMRVAFEDTVHALPRQWLKPNALDPWMTSASSRMGMLRHCASMSNTLKVQLEETTGKPT